MSETVTDADLYQLALDGKLTLSVNLVNGARGQCVSLQPGPEDPWEVPKPLEPWEQLLSKGRRLSVSAEPVPIYPGIWDLPMTGGERFDVERAYHAQCNGPEVTLEEGCVLVERDDWTYRLIRGFGTGRTPLSKLPTDSVFVVRMAALAEFVTRVLGNPTPAAVAALEKPLDTKARATLLTIIAALARKAGIPLSTPSKAAGIIEGLISEIGATVSQRTIENYLNGIPDALERRKT